MKHSFLLLFLLFSTAQISFADILGHDGMLALAERANPTLENSSQKSLFYLENASSKRRKSGSAAMYFPQNFAQMVASLSGLSSWCELLPLHLNVKTCLFDIQNSELVVFLGRKFYQPPEDAYKLVYKFKTIKEDNYFAVMMSAKKGPLKTSDLHFNFEILNINEKSFARIHLSNRQSWLSAVVANIYLSTVGETKPGITITGYHDDGSPTFTSGETASFERNILRYYFAISAFLQNTNKAEASERHISQLNAWYRQTETFTQLYEMNKQAYVSAKLKERINQTNRQTAETFSGAAKYNSEH